MPNALDQLRRAAPQFWLNPQRTASHAPPLVVDGALLGLADMQAAHARFTRFAPLLAELFPGQFFAGPPQEKSAPSGGSDPRSGGAWGQFFAGPPQALNRLAVSPDREKLAPSGLMAAAPTLPAQGGTARRGVDSGNAAACKASDPHSGGAWGLAPSQGQIESALLPAPAMQQALGLSAAHGRLWVKADHSLPVAGSIKARGGFHEVLEWAERLALQHGLLASDADYRGLALPAARAVFARHQVAVGSTGNLGMAIGVLAAALGFRAVVHMSTDAKEWKKQRLRQRGVDVVEHAGDYEQAVARGRQFAQADPLCHFVDDERSLSLFIGYSAAALHLRSQLLAQGVVVDAAHPLLVYIPCGVGGAPSGIAWGLHQLFGEHVHCFFAEPVQSPCFLLQMLSPPGSHPSVYDYGLTNQTQADGLAIPRASLLAAQAMRPLLAGVFTVADPTLFNHLALLWTTEGLRIEPSAAAGFDGPLHLRGHALACPGANHVVWTTGGLLVPDAQYQDFLQQAAH